VTAVEDGSPVRQLPPVHIVPIGEVRESAKNARRITDRAVELVGLSLRRFGWKQPLVVDGERNLVVGHTRHRAARTLGLTHVPIIIADDLTPAELDAYRIADNRTHDFTTWDLPQLAVQLAELEEDFADVLALTDWEALTAGQQAGGGLDVDLPASAATSIDGGFQLNVCFTSKEEALAAEETLLGLPGVFDVRHDF
jgi:hypothetical protein